MNLKSILLLSSAMLVFAQAQSQTHISTNGKKYTLVEEATGNWCGYCPDGAQVIEQTIEPNYPRTIIASWHNGDAMQLTGDPFCSGSGYITGFPLGTVNRTYWGGAIQQNRASGPGIVQQTHLQRLSSMCLWFAPMITPHVLLQLRLQVRRCLH